MVEEGLLEKIRVIIREELNIILSNNKRSVDSTSTHLGDGYLNTKQAADYLGVNEQWVRILVYRGLLACCNDGRKSRKRFLRQDLDQYMSSRKRLAGVAETPANTQPIPQTVPRGPKGLVKRA